MRWRVFFFAAAAAACALLRRGWVLLLRGCGGWRKVLRWVVCLLLRVCVKSDATAQLRRQLPVWRYLFAILRAPRRRNELQKPSCGLCLLVYYCTLALSRN